MFSQTLGTALGDWMADDTGLGYNGSALVIALVIAAVRFLYFFTGVSRTLLFWAAFILMRPLGATIANSFDKSVAQGGLAVGDLKASAVLAVLIVISILLIPQRPGRHIGDTASTLKTGLRGPELRVRLIVRVHVPDGHHDDVQGFFDECCQPRLKKYGLRFGPSPSRQMTGQPAPGLLEYDQAATCFVRRSRRFEASHRGTSHTG